MTEDKLWIGTSWKMNKTLAEARAFAQALVVADGHSRIQRFVMPPFTALREVSAELEGTSVRVGAQNMHWSEAGAWTGEISAPMLVDCGATLVEIGHSERRAHFGETDETVARKVAAAARHGLTPLICLGETREERDAGQASAVLRRQTTAALSGLDPVQKSAPILLAYEPVWAIGAGGAPASPDYAEARHREIIETAAQSLGRAVPCLYGGSVDAENCTAFLARAPIDGLFIGRAAWTVEGYLDILNRCAAHI